MLCLHQLAPSHRIWPWWEELGSVVGPLAVPGMGSDESWPGPIQGLPTGPKGEEAGCRTRDQTVTWVQNSSRGRARGRTGNNLKQMTTGSIQETSYTQCRSTRTQEAEPELEMEDWHCTSIAQAKEKWGFCAHGQCWGKAPHEANKGHLGLYRGALRVLTFLMETLITLPIIPSLVLTTPCLVLKIGCAQSSKWFYCLRKTRWEK